jgi:hypothetical protein
VVDSNRFKQLYEDKRFNELFTVPGLFITASFLLFSELVMFIVKGAWAG